MAILLIEEFNQWSVHAQSSGLVHWDVRKQNGRSMVLFLVQRFNELPCVVFELGLQQRSVDRKRVQNHNSPWMICVIVIFNPKVILSKQLPPSGHMLVCCITVSDIVISRDIHHQRLIGEVSTGPITNVFIMVKIRVSEQALFQAFLEPVHMCDPIYVLMLSNEIQFQKGLFSWSREQSGHVSSCSVIEF
ncbi:hypothetical protein OGAPHI_003493 [Ogataea philodendri]|uniref:Uncharacterized protein n=1 Tax=Ogataea philodendri TaxID=1378263 RepID=A0A9P8P6Z9_9ASCO|nr:uncharacterized protein OGAPHI_003493 [Ogataea philodendri]KAH3666497.1 hypothetical protein OGAPHI_003493 [Ogataea philodendri]